MASFAVKEGRPASKLAEVFVSMANTRGGTVVMGVRDSNRTVVGVGLRGAVQLGQDGHAAACTGKT